MHPMARFTGRMTARIAPFLGLMACLVVAQVACSSTDAVTTDSGTDPTGTGPGSTTGDGAAGTSGGTSGSSGSAGDGSTSGDGPATGCGTCPTGSTCGSANGLPVCRAASGVPLFSHVFVIMMENTSKASLDAATNTPYLTGLAKSAAVGSDYHGTSHPSLPNYLALTSGSDHAVGCDCDPVGSACSLCNTLAFPSGCGCNQASAHLGDQLDTAGKTWKAYGEGMSKPCDTVTAGAYATKHIPFLYYQNMLAESAGARCTSHVVPYTGFAADLAGAAPEFSFIAPSLDHDMHGSGLQQSATDVGAGDTWLSTNAKAIIDSAAYKNGGLLVIVWDEDDGSGGILPPKTDDPIPIFVLSPYAKSAGYVSPVKGDHYSLLATIEDGLGLPRIGSAVGKTTLADYFPAN
ncbi:MAG: putative acid phosphatase [Myxococcaceae bacterium]|nr:putative acid phosphatase [Myxococcaceae bacterium]